MIDNKIMRVFVVISLAMLFFFLWQMWKEYHPPYLSYQKEFKELLIQNAAGSEEVADFQIGVRQRWVEQLNRVDRCETCHLGIEDPRFNNAPQPFKSHPDVDTHPIEKFGCTVCHGGWPMATSLEKSHGPTENFQEAIYHENFMEKSCLLCHGDNIKEQAPVVAKGRESFKEMGCRGCHKIQGIKRVKVGPPLVKIGEKVKKDWLYRWLIDPKDAIQNAKMPDFKLTDQEAADIAGYLLSLTRSGPKNDIVIGSYERGKKIFSDSQCVSCHPVRGSGGEEGPELGKISSKVHPEWLVGWFKNPKAWRSNSKMPTFGFSDQDVQDLTRFMLDEFVDRDLKKTTVKGQIETVEAANIAHGMELIGHYGCAGCHEIIGAEDPGEIGVELTTIGDLHISKADFGMLEVAEKDRTIPNWLYNKMKNPKAIGKDAKMPDFGFSEQEAEAMTTYLELRRKVLKKSSG